jgi:hypothetical protein
MTTDGMWEVLKVGGQVLLFLGECLVGVTILALVVGLINQAYDGIMQGRMIRRQKKQEDAQKERERTQREQEEREQRERGQIRVPAANRPPPRAGASPRRRNADRERMTISYPRGNPPGLLPVIPAAASAPAAPAPAAPARSRSQSAASATARAAAPARSRSRSRSAARAEAQAAQASQDEAREIAQADAQAAAPADAQGEEPH